MHDLLHVEHLFFDLPDFPSDFKYFVKIVNICTNYLANSLSDFSEIIPQIVKNAYLRIPIFKISRGSMPPDPLEGARAGPRCDRVAITSFGVLEFHAPPPPPRDSNPGSATEQPMLSWPCWSDYQCCPSMPSKNSAGEYQSFDLTVAQLHQ